MRTSFLGFISGSCDLYNIRNLKSANVCIQGNIQPGLVLAKTDTHSLTASSRCLLYHRASWASTASCLSEQFACCRLCMSACFCLRPRGSLCQPSQVNSTSSTSKARTNGRNLRHKLSISWVRCVSPRPYRQTFVTSAVTLTLTWSAWAGRSCAQSNRNERRHRTKQQLFGMIFLITGGWAWTLVVTFAGKKSCENTLKYKCFSVTHYNTDCDLWYNLWTF